MDITIGTGSYEPQFTAGFVQLDVEHGDRLVRCLNSIPLHPPTTDTIS